MGGLFERRTRIPTYLTMASTTSSLDTGHTEMIHDAQLDYYGKRLATCSSDRTIKIFEVGGDSQKLLAELKGHEGPVWQVCWAHPKYNNVLASCSYDRKVIIWEEVSRNNWKPIYTHTEHTLSVNSISWAPHEYGLMLACGPTDGSVSILTVKSTDRRSWVSKKFPAHKIGVTAVSWAPAPIALAEGKPTDAPLEKVLASAGCDNDIRIWSYESDTDSWKSHTLKGHTDWVRDVAW